MTSKTKTTGRKNRRKRGYSRWGMAFQFLLLGVLASIVVVGVSALFSVTRKLPAMEELGLSSAATKILSADGVLLARIYRENREYIRIAEIPQAMQDATIAVEDVRFFTHRGLDARGIARAVVSNVKGGEYGQGASTITQQLARNVYDLGRQKTMSRKLEEAIIALRLERRYTKREILEGYLNEVYYGARAYGVQAASLLYFGKPIQKVTLAESALLAGLPQRPTDLNPYKNKAAAKSRRNIVLARMAELGFITRAEAAKAQKEEIRLAYVKPHEANDWKAPYFVDTVIRQLEERYGPDVTYKGGLEVHTTLHYKMQQAAETAVQRGHDRAARRRLIQDKTQVALTCVDPHNGYIRAMVGGTSWNRTQFNRATNNKRQPGSTFKLFVYTAALNEGWSQYRRVNDSPKSWPQASGKRWRPGNYDGRWRGNVTLRRAVANSINMVAIKTAESVGMADVIQVARKLGLEGPLPNVLATSIGAGGASTLELAGAYGAFAVKGQFIKPYGIVKVLDRDGNIMEEVSPRPVQVLKPSVVEEMNDMLRAVVTEGTGRVAGAIANSHGKTGTTQDDRDAWWVGFTPQLAAAVWIGNDDYTPMRHAYGGEACAPIWVDFMQDALRLNPKDRPDFTNTAPPVTSGAEQQLETDSSGQVRLKICTSSGKIATSRCPAWRTRRFQPEDAPTETCDLHVGRPLSTARTARTDTRDENTVRPVRNERTEPRATARNEREAPSAAVARESRMETVMLCADTGLQPSAYCPRIVTRRMPRSAVPVSVCTLHGPSNP